MERERERTANGQRGTASSARTPRPTSSACAAGSGSSTRSRVSAPSGCGSSCSAEPYVAALGALTGAQAVQMVKAGLKAIYLSGWQVAADANLSGHTYPDQSLYPANSAPALVQPDQQRAAPRRPDRLPRRARTARTGSRRSSPTPRRASAGRSTRSS